MSAGNNVRVLRFPLTDACPGATRVAEKDMQMINAPLPSNYNGGKPITNKQYELQGWNAARAGFKAEDCPYYATSTAEKYWLKGIKS